MNHRPARPRGQLTDCHCSVRNVEELLSAHPSRLAWQDMMDCAVRRSTETSQLGAGPGDLSLSSTGSRRQGLPGGHWPQPDSEGPVRVGVTVTVPSTQWHLASEPSQWHLASEPRATGPTQSHWQS